MNIAVISDLHLGSEDATDSFGHDDAEFLRFLRFLERNFERVVLLGDIWETLAERCPWRASRGLSDARGRHPEIARRFRLPSYQYIHGNHDLIASSVDGAPAHWSLDVAGKRLLFMHGHGHDRWIRLARQVVELGVWIGGWMRRAGWHALYARLAQLEQARFDTPAARQQDCSFQTWAMRVGAESRADIVVTGHTHVPRVAAHGPRLYLNSGSCSRGQFTYLALDTRRDVYGVHHAW